MASSSSSSERCFASVEEKENINIEGNKKIKAIMYDQRNIRSGIIEEFCKRNLEIRGVPRPQNQGCVKDFEH